MTEEPKTETDKKTFKLLSILGESKLRETKNGTIIMVIFFIVLTIILIVTIKKKNAPEPNKNGTTSIMRIYNQLT